MSKRHSGSFQRFHYSLQWTCDIHGHWVSVTSMSSDFDTDDAQRERERERGQRNEVDVLTVLRLFDTLLPWRQLLCSRSWQHQ